MHRFFILAIILGLPASLWAEFSETVVLPVNGSLNFDTGQVGSSGGDIVWDGHTIDPQGTVVLRNREHAPGFDTWGQMFVDLQLRGASADPIAENFVVPGDVFLAKSNGGHDVKARIEANNRSSLVLRFTTFAAAPAGVPLVTQVVNNSSFLPFGYPNYGIAPSSLFVVQGTNLADPGDPVLHSSEAPGLPLTLHGASLTVVVNGVTTHPALYYTSPTQLAAVLPAATPVGSGTLTVTYNGQTSPPTPMIVVSSALGINTYYGNIGVATDAFTGALLTYTNSGVAGQTIVLWSTGLGPNPADSDTTLTLTPHAVNTPLEIFIGGVRATILYAGASPYPGVNQINLTIPQGVPAGCWVPLVAITNGVSVGNVVTLPITSGGGACKDVISQFTGDQLALSPGQTVLGGLLGLLHIDTPENGQRSIQNVANGAFQRYSGIYVPDAQVSPGGCIVGPLIAKPFGQVRGLDPGSIRLTGPSGLDLTLPIALGVKGAYYSMLGANVLTSGGTFAFHGSGGADVGSFDVTLDIRSPLLTWTNAAEAANIDKSKGLLVKWTGGNPGSFVIISGSVPTAQGTFVRYQCEVSADAGQFQVPSYILSALPDGPGPTDVQNHLLVPFGARGLDVAAADAVTDYTVNSVYASSGLTR
jgi:uncharacterized protein (TIGR03437 family)